MTGRGLGQPGRGLWGGITPCEAARFHTHSPVHPISAYTAVLCAESNHRLPPCTTLSSLDTWASFALRWAARNRATFCSGVSRKGGDPALLPRPAGPGPAVEAEEGAGEEVGAAKRVGGAAALEFACRVLAVKRVASETLRGAARRRRVGFILRSVSVRVSRRGRQGGALAAAEGRECGSAAVRQCG